MIFYKGNGECQIMIRYLKAFLANSKLYKKKVKINYSLSIAKTFFSKIMREVDLIMHTSSSRN